MKRLRLMVAIAAALVVGMVIVVKVRPAMTEAEVLRIAEPAMEAEFPDSFAQCRPYRAKFGFVDRVWHVRGTLSPPSFGGTPNAEVNDADRRVRRMYHTQ
jgi:hypothetical protein